MTEDGTFTTYVGTSSGSQAVFGAYERYTPAGAIIATYTATSPDPSEAGAPTVYTDPYEMLLTADNAGVEHVHLFGYIERATATTTSAAWHEVLRQRTDGTVEFRWKSWTHFSDSDNTEGTINDPDHTNSLAIDPTDGNYVVSFRSTDAVLKLDYSTGAVLWQLGGKQNQFQFVNDEMGGFYGQHSVRVLANGDLLIYDDGNQHSPPESRAVEYRLDTTTMTATVVWEFRRAGPSYPPIFTPYMGSVERLSSGNTLVSFAMAGVTDEVDAAGNVVWEGWLLNGGGVQGAYRVRRLESLYEYRDP